jgi:glucose-6-phosphate 1-dehydrogenase
MKNKIIIFGATGDLSKRKLLPALRTLFLDGNLNETKIFLLSRREGKKEDLLNASFNVAIEEEFANINEFVKVEDKIEDFINLFNIADIKNDEQVLLYLSLPPENVQKYIELLGNSGFVKPNIKIMIEKPFGYDLLSAQELLQTINKYFNNEQVYKIDHYLMKETIQKMQEFKLLNTKLMDKMNNEYVKEIEIRALENIDIQGRVNFYEQTGALRDFIQSHLMIILNQIICRPQSKNDILLARKNAINNINIVTDFNNAYRAQYLGYKEETKNENSLVETFVKVSLTSNEEN